jgi:hypothetical protein
MIFKATFWRKYDVDKQINHYVLVFHDFHNFSLSLNKKQIAYFNKNNRFENTCLIIEDSYSVAWCKEHAMFSVLAVLLENLQASHQEVYGIEFRFKKMKSYGHCIHALTYTQQEQFNDLNQKLRNENLSMQAIAEEFITAYELLEYKLKDLKKSNKITASFGEKLKDILKDIQEKYSKQINTWQEFEGTLLEYMQKNICLTENFLNEFLSFDAKLLDIKALLTVLESKKLTSALFLGSLHCYIVEEFLLALGYEMYEIQGTEFNPMTDRIMIPAMLQHNPGQQIVHMVRSEKLRRFPSGQLLKALNCRYFEKLNDPEKKITLSWLERIYSFFKNLLPF